MADIILHPITAAKLQSVTERPSHAILISGARGIGKGSVAQRLAASLLGVEPAQLANQAYLRQLSPGKEAAISIDSIRELEHFLALRVPGSANRVIIIEDTHTLTAEAQNALLKTLEEPPERTTLILTAASEQSLLPTIRSRMASLPVQRPTSTSLQQHFSDLGYSPTAIQRSQLMSGGLPGLMSAMLSEDADHPLVAAAVTAREIIQKSTFERLAMVDQLSKQKPYCLDVLAIMQQMAQLTLAGAKPSKTWQNILSQAYNATDQLLGNGQPKLVLTNLMLKL